nr:contractile injection system protein, VgrG/Pvc8 family [uncultured Cohaesibacter sp.]
MRSFYFSVMVGGTVVLSGSSLNGLNSITINDNDGETADTATITLDDTDGRNRLPQKNDDVVIMIGRSSAAVVKKFTGKVTGVQSVGGSGGRTITVNCDSADMSGKGKEPLQKSWKGKTVKEILTDAASKAGYQAPKIDDSIGSIVREKEVADGESFLEFARRLAGEVGGRFKMFGDQPVMVDAKGGTSASGASLAALAVTWGDNLISWSISPRDNRSDHSEYQSKYFDLEQGKWVTVSERGKSEAKAKAKNAKPTATKDEAESQAKADKDAGDRGAGAGSVSLDGDASLIAGGTITLVGARPGIDGTYTVSSCTHTLDTGGYNCSAQLEHPQGDAGTDGR